MANNSTKHNLLSVHDLATRYGLVTFTKEKGTIYDTRHIPPRILATAPWKTNHYEFCGTTVAPNTAYGTRTYSRKHHKQIKPKHALTAPSPQPPTPQLLPSPVTANKTPTIRTNTLPSIPNPTNLPRPSNSELQTHDWHLKLNHANVRKLSLTAKHGLIAAMPKSLSTDLTLSCKPCASAKHHPVQHKRTKHHYATGAYISSNTCGPIKTTSTHGNNHILILICAASRHTFAHFLKDRKDMPEYIDKTLQHI